jgi:hypothetical protein
MTLALRKAVFADIPALNALIARSARGLSTEDYRAAQIEGALRGAFGVDTQLLADETYFVVEDGGQIVGCGGWSFRSTLFGSDARAGRDSSILNPGLKRRRSAPSLLTPATPGAASVPYCSIIASSRHARAAMPPLS